MAPSGDDALRRAAWAGRIPTMIMLARDELATIEEPHPCFLSLPRQSFLPFHVKTIIEHFKDHVPPCPDELWLEAAGAPLKWNIPIGVLFDCLRAAADEGHGPWALTAHFRSFPTSLLRGGGVVDTKAVTAHVLNTLKEAAYLQHGSAESVMSLSASDQRRLLKAVETGSYEDFMASKLPVAQTGGPAPKRLPVRVHTRAGWQQPHVSLKVDGEMPLSAVLDAVQQESASEEEPAQDREVVVQGVSVEPSLPLLAVWRGCAHPDGFLHVVLRPAKQGG